MSEISRIGLRTNRAWALSAIAAALLAACGGGDVPFPDRGSVIGSSVLGQATAAEIDASTGASGVQALTGLSKCSVDLRYLVYRTHDPQGQPATASEGVFVPSGADPACTGNRPVLLYAHGTNTAKSFNMADVSRNAGNTAFNNAAGPEASLALAFYAAQGFIVVMPNYLGYENSSLDYHPYLNAEAQAVDMVDGLRAAKALLATDSPVKPSGKLFISGYSEGGHVAMATHKIIERDYGSEFTVTASAPMSGPYNLVGFGDVVAGPGPVNLGATIFVPLLMTSYQKSYGEIYAKPSEVYQAPFDATAEALFPTDTPLATLIAQGKLPADSSFTKLFGAGGLLTDSFRVGYVNSNYRKALLRNTLTGQDTATGTTIGWTTQRPLSLCGAAQDPTVFWAVNTPVAQQVLAARGATVVVRDLENRATLPAGALGDQIYAGFQQSKTAAAPNTIAKYHGTLVPPFCNALSRGFFQQVLATGQ
jgi:Prolyl oligopeptidase family